MATDKDTCCGNTLRKLLRFTCSLVVAIGLAIAAYGVYQMVKEKGFTVVAGVTFAVGVFLAIMALLMILCGHSRRWFLNFFMFTFGAFTLAEVGAAIAFLVPSSQEKIVGLINDDSVKTLVQDHLEQSGWVLIVASGVQVVTFVLAWMRSSQLQKGFEEDLDEDGEYGAIELEKDKSGKNPLLKDSGSATTASDDLESGRPPTAKERYREKTADIRDKYKIRR